MKNEQTSHFRRFLAGIGRSRSPTPTTDEPARTSTSMVTYPTPPTQPPTVPEPILPKWEFRSRPSTPEPALSPVPASTPTAPPAATSAKNLNASHLQFPDFPAGTPPNVNASTSPVAATLGTATPGAQLTSLMLPQDDNSLIVVPCNVASLWEKALAIAQEKLEVYNLPPLDLGLHSGQSQTASEIIQLIIQELHEDISRDHGKSGMMGQLQDTLKTLDYYTVVVDTAIQQSPYITALVWAGLRAMLKVTLNHIEATESLKMATATIIGKMAVCDFYASVYAESTLLITTPMSRAITTRSALRDALHSALPELYASILVFTMKTRQYFNPLTSRRAKLAYLLKPFAIEFQPFIDDMSEKQRLVEECAKMATMKRILEDSRKLNQMESLLKVIKSKVEPLARLEEIAIIAKESSNLVREIQAKLEDDRVHGLLQMLSTLNSPGVHQDIQSRRTDHTGTWLLEDSRFRLWCDTESDNRALCCYGIPGAGKTMMSSIVIDDLVSRFSQIPQVGIAWIYCDYRDQTNQSLVNILGSILRQFLRAVSTSHTLGQIEKILDSTKKSGTRVDILQVLPMLKLTLSQMDCSFLCLDALDELVPQTLVKLLQILQSEFSSVRIFLTGRPHIQQIINDRLQIQDQNTITLEAHPEDIRKYLKHQIQLDRELNPEEMSLPLEEEILDLITQRSEGMFLLPALHIRMVLEEPTVEQRRQAIKILPSTLDDAFVGMVARIRMLPPKRADLGMRVLLLLHLAYRPLQLAEIRHALAVGPGNKKLVTDNIPTPQMILSCTLGLVIVDDETSIVRFVHYAVEEHFRSYGNIIFPQGLSTVAEICLAYLTLDKLTSYCETVEELNQKVTDFKFLEYAACYWGNYVRRQDKERVGELVVNLLHYHESGPNCALQVLFCSLCHLESISMFSFETRLSASSSTPQFPRGRKRNPKRFFGAHAAAYFGLAVVLGKRGSCEDWAIVDDNGQTPLLLASIYGHDTVVQLLLNHKDVDVNAMSNGARTPLAWAASLGHAAVVRLLLQQIDIDVNAQDKSNRTPLALASLRGHEAVVKLLLEHQDVHVNTNDEGGRLTPLAWAACGGHEAVVKVLLEHQDVHVNANDKGGRTPLAWATWGGHEAVVKLLLEHEHESVDVNSNDKSGQTPLALAVSRGDQAIVRLLLGHKSIDVNVHDKSGKTPLALAILRGDKAIVKLLLEHKSIDVNSNDKSGHTPLALAAWCGDWAVVEMLLQHKDADVNASDKRGRTPLALAAWNGHKAVVKLLLAHEDTDVNARDKKSRTPLELAASCGHETVVKRLLRHESIDISSNDKISHTPLEWAASYRYEAAVQLQLEHKNVEINTNDESGRTSLELAAWNAKSKVAKEMLQAWAMQEGLPWLARGDDHEAVVQLLLEHKDVDVNANDEEGRTPLASAASLGHAAVVRLLLQHVDIDVNANDTRGQTPLALARKRNHEPVVKLLQLHLDLRSKQNDPEDSEDSDRLCGIAQGM